MEASLTYTNKEKPLMPGCEGVSEGGSPGAMPSASEGQAQFAQVTYGGPVAVAQDAKGDMSSSQYVAPFVAPTNLSGVDNAQPESSLSPSNVTPPPNIEMKLFVGRVPRTMDETSLHPIFSEFGVVSEIAIIKDRATGMHKGSAFCRMASITQADAAIRALNNVRVLDPQLGPLQVRYATGEVEKLGMSAESAYPGQDQAKLFVGSLPRNITEEEVRALFQRCGEVDEVFIMRDSATGQGKGCAFVKFAYKEQAIHAIKVLSGVQQLPGAPRPLEVRFAESKKALQSQQAAAAAAAAGTPTSGAAAVAVRSMTTGTSVPVAANAATGMMQGSPTATMYGQPAAAAAAAAPTNPAYANCNPRTAGPWKEYFTDEGRPYYHNETTAQTQWERPAEFDRQDVAGPPGANIFVFHVPNDWTQADLLNNFQPFGQVVSARIATDKATGRNKGYAFVSYATIQSAAQAVQQMNGCMAGQKRLKVSIKQNEEIYVQHLLGSPQPASASMPADPAFAYARPVAYAAPDAASNGVRQDVSAAAPGSYAAAGGPQRW